MRFDKISFFKRIGSFIIYVLAVFIVIVIRLIKPIVLIRYSNLFCTRIGHFAANTEIYLCEKDAGINLPKKFTFDIFYIEKPISNLQLLKMWKRRLTIVPSWLLCRVKYINELIPGWELHEVGYNTSWDRDVHNLLDLYPSHLKFSIKEEIEGQEQLKNLGLPYDAKFVCLLVRDNTYLNYHQPEHDWSVHDYRDSNIQNYIPAIQELVDRDYYVVRMGVVVKEPVNFQNPRFIDYAIEGKRTDFLDIYLGAKCQFCISTGSGWDAVPGVLFRKPVLITNFAPPGFFSGFSKKYLWIFKNYFDTQRNRCLTWSEIFDEGLAFCLDANEFKKKSINLIENSPQEILNATVEMICFINNNFESNCDLNEKFLEKFPKGLINPYNNCPSHGKSLSKVGSSFLAENKFWLQ